MKKTIWKRLLFLSLMLAFLASRKAFGDDACTSARFNDSDDAGCRQTPGGPGAPASGAASAGGNNAYCPTCQPAAPSITGPDNATADIAATGMPRWWVDEPYINLHVVDEPLSYTTSSGQRMTFRLNYKQRFSLPGLDQVPSQILPDQPYPNPNRMSDDNYVNTMHEAAPNPGSVNAGGMTNAIWSHNWMMHIVFWDWNWEASRVGYTGGVGGESYAFEDYYEAFLFQPDGGVRYFTYAGSYGGSPIAGETLNPPTQLTNSVSQAQLLMGNPMYFTDKPTSDTNGVYWGNGTNGLTVLYPDGSKDVFDLLNWFPFANTTRDALLTQRVDPQGRVTRLGYQAVIITNSTLENTTNSYFRVRYVVDTDGRTNTFLYTNSTANPWLLREIDDPFGRKATFAYNSSNWLSTITDAANNTNTFAYTNSPSPSGWLKSLTTPYGTTTFSYFQQMDTGNPSNYVERVALVNEPGGASQLFAYVHNLSGIVEASANSPTVPDLVSGGNFVFDDGTTGGADDGLFHRNSFHWDRKQFEDLSGTPSTASAITNYLGQADFQKASMKHWLLGADGISVTETLSSTRAPSPDPGGQIEGQWAWYGYTNNTPADTEVTSQVGAIAQLLPDGTTQYASFNYQFTLPFYDQGNPTPCVSSNQQTYTKSDGSVGVLTTWFHYTNNNIDLYSVSNSIGQSVGMGYNSSHEVTSITNALSQVTTLTYTNTANLISVNNYSGQSINFTYYATNAASTNCAAFVNTVIVQPQGLTTTISDYTNGLPRVVQVSGTSLTTLLVSNTWDNLNRPTGTIFPDGTTTLNAYTNLDLIAQKDRLGNTTHFLYDSLDHLQHITNALNKVTSLEWCDCGSLTSITDPLTTNTTVLNYDNQGRLTNVLFPDGSSVTDQYDLSGRLTSRTDGAGNWISFNHNNQGRVTAVSNAYGQVIGIGYDAVNRPVTITNADGVVVTRTYDLLNRVITNTWPDTTAELFQYSSNGLIAYTNQDGQFTLFGRDGAGRLTAVTNNLLQTNQFTYDALDHLISLTDGLGHNTSWQFNQFGLMVNKLNNLGASLLTNGFDANGQLTTRYMPATGITTYKWDAAGNLTNLLYPSRTNTYTYDADNRLTGMADTNGADVLLSSFTYTGSGQLATETSPWASDTITLLYSQGRRTNLNLTQPTGSWNQGYLYDAAWRLQTLDSPAGSFGYAYSAVNPASALFRTLSLPNAATITNHYDSMARLDYTALLNYWGHPLDGYSYRNDSWGLRTNITRQLGLTTNIVTASYDGIGELSSWTGKESSGANRQNEQLGYGFDSAGNLSSRTNGAMIQTFTVNSLNQISNTTRSGAFTVTGATPAPAASVTVNGAAAQTNGDFTFASSNNSLANGTNTVSIIARNMLGVSVTNVLIVNLPTSVNQQYDGNGNLTNDGTRSLYFDGENQLTNVTVANQYQVLYLYDGFGLRRIRRAYTWQSGAWALTNEIHYIYDGNNVIQERDTNNNVLVIYTRGQDLSASLQGAGGVGGLLARTDANGTTYYHTDGSGNVTALMDGNENMVARYEYDGFGRLIGKWGSMADANVYRFSSKEYDAVTGLYYFGGRYYDPVLQRFLNRDPIDELGGLNLYRFVGNNPVNFVDPYGLDPAFSPGIGMFQQMTANQEVQAAQVGAPLSTAGILALTGAGALVEAYGGSFLAWLGLGAAVAENPATQEELGELEADIPNLSQAADTTSKCEDAAEAKTYLYQKLGANGEHLKFGITGNPGTRYTVAEMNGGQLNIIAQGARDDMLQLERNLHETLPMGPEEGQQFYIQKQIEKGLTPPPYKR